MADPALGTTYLYMHNRLRRLWAPADQYTEVERGTAICYDVVRVGSYYEFKVVGMEGKFGTLYGEVLYLNTEENMNKFGQRRALLRQIDTMYTEAQNIDVVTAALFDHPKGADQ